MQRVVTHLTLFRACTCFSSVVPCRVTWTFCLGCFPAFLQHPVLYRFISYQGWIVHRNHSPNSLHGEKKKQKGTMKEHWNRLFSSEMKYMQWWCSVMPLWKGKFYWKDFFCVCVQSRFRYPSCQPFGNIPRLQPTPGSFWRITHKTVFTAKSNEYLVCWFPPVVRKTAACDTRPVTRLELMGPSLCALHCTEPAFSVSPNPVLLQYVILYRTNSSIQYSIYDCIIV